MLNFFIKLGVLFTKVIELGSLKNKEFFSMLLKTEILEIIIPKLWIFLQDWDHPLPKS